MSEFVNILARIQANVQGAGVRVWQEAGTLRVEGPSGPSSLRIVPLYRPSSEQIEREADEDALLVLTAATPKAVAAAARHNHVFLPGGGYRIVAPGLALINDAPVEPADAVRQVRLTGKTGVVAETLLLGGCRPWTVQELAAAAKVSPALAHRVATRLEQEGILNPEGRGPEKTRTLTDARALADLWSREERVSEPWVRGFLYGASAEAIARKALEICPAAAVGGALAANLYKPVLTQVLPPIRIWMPAGSVLQGLTAAGFEQTRDGANLELVQVPNDPWTVHRTLAHPPSSPFARVSRWRAWLEVAGAEGRVRELADALRSDLEQEIIS